MNEIPAAQDISLESLVAQLADEFTDRLGRGEQPSVEEYVQRYPRQESVIRNLLASLRLIHLTAADPSGMAASPAVEVQPEGPLGDYRIVAEIGRGGMGVVYEAVQISLGRRVALKVLPFAAGLDAKQLQRFKNEAQAVAHLHHQNIVPVYATGCERGVHFYAMQFIEGQSLSALIHELRQLAGLEVRPCDTPALPQASGAEPIGPYLPDNGTATAPIAGLPTERSIRHRGHFQMVARLGVQAAEALEHAHQLGVVHRDIKPANLLVDVRGNLWVTDFGLAHCQSQAALTLSGDLVGTLRYMSPEQALAQRVMIDHRSDIYSLGVTLYELLALEPAFSGRDRQEVLRQVAFEEPRPPRRLNPAIPAELETIVLKAVEKNPTERYATAQDLADDLRRYLEDKPIRARRPTLWHKSKKWARRNRAVVWTAGACLLLAVAIATGGISWIVSDRAARWALAEEKVQLALEDATKLQRHARWAEALEAVKRAEGILASGGDRDLRERVGELRKDLEMILRLEEAWLPRPTRGVEHHYFDAAWVDASYANAFREYGIDVERLEPAEAAERIRARAIRVELTAALDSWARRRRESRNADDPSWKRIVAVALAADPDEWRNQVRQAVLKDQTEALHRLAQSEKIADQPLQTLSLLAVALRDPEASAIVLRVAQRKYPDDFHITFLLASMTQAMWRPQLDESIRFYTAALAIRPRNLHTHCWLGLTLHRRGRLDEAIAVLRRAAELDPEYTLAHKCLAAFLHERGKFEEALGEYRQVFEREPDSVEACNGLAWLLATCPDLKLRDADRAVQLAKRAVDRIPQMGQLWNTLGVAQYRAGHWQESKAALEKSLQLLRGQFESFNTFFLAMTHWRLGEPEAARKWHHQAVAWMEKNMPQDADLRRFRAEADQLLGIRREEKKETK